MKKVNIIIGALILLSLFAPSCKKFVEVDPPITRVAADNVFESDATAIAVLTGIYNQLSATAYNGTTHIPTISLWAGLSADEYTLWSGATSNLMAYYKNALSITAGGYELWNNLYPLIFTCNSAIEGLTKSNSLTPGIQHQLLGEAKFLRGFFYFYLVNLYGDVPLVLTTDYTKSSGLPRNPKDEVYKQIVVDLKEAEELLGSQYLNGALQPYTVNAERVRPTKWSAKALLARVYLYTGDWVNAEAKATEVITQNSIFTLAPNLNNVFIKNSSEAIWQLQPVVGGTTTFTNTQEAVLFNLTVAPAGLNSTHPVYLSSGLINSFESGDARRLNWTKDTVMSGVTYSYPYKYKVVANGAAVSEYRMIIRLGELFLIRAEARLKQSNISGAQADLNSIRNRATLPNTTANDGSSLLAAILQERRIELFSELGTRWPDLKRTGTVDVVMSLATPLKGGIWNTNQQLYPIPVADIQKDPSILQNPSY